MPTETNSNYNVLKDEAAQKTYAAELRSHSPNSPAFTETVKVRPENDADFNFTDSPTTIGETFVKQETTDPNENVLSVNRFLNITALGAKLGQGATNSGYEVLGVEGLPADFENRRLCVKAYHSFDLASRGDWVVYQARQSDFMSDLALADNVTDGKEIAEMDINGYLVAQGLAPRQVGFVRQRAPVENEAGNESYFTVPVMEMVGDADFSLATMSHLTIAEQKLVLDEVERVLTLSNDYAKARGFVIGDHGLRFSMVANKPRVYIIDVGLLGVNLGLDYDPKDEVAKYRERLRRLHLL